MSLQRYFRRAKKNYDSITKRTCERKIKRTMNLFKKNLIQKFKKKRENTNLAMGFPSRGCEKEKRLVAANRVLINKRPAWRVGLVEANRKKR